MVHSYRRFIKLIHVRFMYVFHGSLFFILIVWDAKIVKISFVFVCRDDEIWGRGDCKGNIVDCDRIGDYYRRIFG